MSSVRILALFGVFAPLAACTAPAVPVSALPGPRKDAMTFNKDETACRRAAARAAYPAGTAPRTGNVNVDWQSFFTSYAKCESARGNVVQPVPWAIAYQLYLGAFMPPAYPLGYPPPPMAAYPYPYPGPYGYP